MKYIKKVCLILILSLLIFGKVNAEVLYTTSKPKSEDSWYFVSNVNGTEYYKFDQEENQYLPVGKLDYNTLVELDLNSKTKIEDKEISDILYFENIDDTYEEIGPYIVYLEDMEEYVVEDFDKISYYRDFRLKEQGIHLFSEPSKTSKILKESIPVGTSINSNLTLCKSNTYDINQGTPNGWIYINVDGVRGWTYRITEEKDGIQYSYCTNGEKDNNDENIDLDNKPETNISLNNISENNDLITQSNIVTQDLKDKQKDSNLTMNLNLTTYRLLILCIFIAIIVVLTAFITILAVNKKKNSKKEENNGNNE